MNFESRILKGVLLLPFMLALQAQAIDFIATNSYIIAEDQIVSEEQWVAAGRVDVEGTFKNDLFVTSGGPLRLNGSYEGNVWGAAAVDITLGGRCERNVRLAGKSVRLDGVIDGNVMAIAETIIATTNAIIGGNVRLIGTSIILEGSVAGNVSITSARIATLGGTINGNANVAAPDILVSRDMQILGDLSYTANKELVLPEGVVGGKLERIIPPSPPLFSMERLLSRSLWFVAALLVGISFVSLFPMTTAMATQLAKKSPLKCLLVGFLASGALPMFGLMCVSSIVGVPLGALTLAAWGIIFYLSRIIVGLVLGTLILRTVSTSMGRILLAMALGLAIIYLASLFPAIGIPVQMTVLWVGMGSLILALLQKRQMIIKIPKELQHLKELRDEKYKPEED